MIPSPEPESLFSSSMATVRSTAASPVTSATLNSRLPLSASPWVKFEIVDAEGLSAVNQRARDEFVEAEGFADALPLGDGI